MRHIDGLVSFAFVTAMLSGCAAGDNFADGDDSVDSADTEAAVEIACTANPRDVRFSRSLLDGPELTRDEFVDTEAGVVLEAVFFGGDGEAENGQYRESEGFSIASESVVLGYKDARPVFYFEIEDAGRVRGWGGCQPNLVKGDLVAARWSPREFVPPGSTSFAIRVEGGGCTTDDGLAVITEIESVDVHEDVDRVEIVVWTRERPFGMCAGVGVDIDAGVKLEAALGERSLMDGGTVPATAPGR